MARLTYGERLARLVMPGQRRGMSKGEREQQLAQIIGVGIKSRPTLRPWPVREMATALPGRGGHPQRVCRRGAVLPSASASWEPGRTADGQPALFRFTPGARAAAEAIRAAGREPVLVRYERTTAPPSRSNPRGRPLVTVLAVK